MARIVLADTGVSFDGRSPDSGPLGGAETAFVRLAEALAARGHGVDARTDCAEPVLHNGVHYAPLASGMPDFAHLYIANRSDKLLRLLPTARSVAFWLHNDARYVLKWRYLSKLWRRRPTLVFLSRSHAASCPAWVPARGRIVAPLAVDGPFRDAPDRTAPPPPVAVYASNPARGLDEVLRLWAGAIAPSCPGAVLRVYASAAPYGRPDEAAAAILARAASTPGVELRDPVPRAEIAAAFASARLMLYPGDPAEAFCLAVAEAQASGLPAVVYRRGALPERVLDGESGIVAADEAGFVAGARRLLSDDAFWLACHRRARTHGRMRSWADVAADFERLLA